MYNDIHIFVDGSDLTKVSHTQFLDVHIHESLTWQHHNTYVTNIISKYSGILFRLKSLLPRSTLFCLYKALVPPHLHYCNIIWADSNNCNLKSIFSETKKDCQIMYKFNLVCALTASIFSVKYSYHS